MKKLNLIYSLLLLSVFTSCQKNHVTKSPDTSDNKPPLIAAVHDSISYTVDGKTYTNGADSYSYSQGGSEEPNRKVVYPDSNNKSVYALIGNPDSVLFYRRTTILSNNANLTIFFIKKYRKKHQNDGILYFPELKDVLKLYAVGKYPYSEDFERENSQEGMALTLSANNKGYSSYSPFSSIKSSQLKPGYQKNSTFEIISFTQTTSGGYNLEAKFTAVIADDQTEEQKKIENGYLRLYFNSFQ